MTLAEDIRQTDARQETAYLFRSPANARRLLDAYARATAGQGEDLVILQARCHY